MAEVTGIAEIRRRLKNVEREYPAALASARQDEAAAMLEATKVPHRSGTLQESAFVSEPKNVGGRSVIVAGFRAPYAKYVNAKTGFFRKAVNALKRGYARRLADAVIDAVKTNATPAGELSPAPTQTAKPRPKKRAKRG